MAQTIAIIGSKGGVGKTTLTMSLLVSARMAGIRAVGVDLDPQGTLTAWAALRGGQEPEAPVVQGDLATWRRAVPPGTDLAILDTPPGLPDSRTARAVHRLALEADLVLVPALAEDLSLIAVGPPARALAELGAAVVIVLNRVEARSVTLPDVRRYLAGHAELCPVEIPRLADINREPGHGRAVVEDERLGGCGPLREVWAFAAGRLGLG